MNRMWWQGALLFSLLPAVLLAVGGCSRDAPQEQAKGKATPVAAKKVDDHSGWWCDEHGVPEEICGQCNARYAAGCKKKGDWCEKHDRPDSQCFICHPELEARFAAMYEARYGKKPPQPQEESKDKDK